MTLTAHAPWRLGPPAPGVTHTHNAYCYRCPFGLTYPSCELRCAKDLEEKIRTETNGQIAAVLAEPIQGVGGFITPPKEFFGVIVGIARKYGGVFICDEVQSGWGRTGHKWCGIEHWGVTPDIVTFAKGIANGFPMGATVARADIADAFTGSPSPRSAAIHRQRGGAGPSASWKGKPAEERGCHGRAPSGGAGSAEVSDHRRRARHGPHAGHRLVKDLQTKERRWNSWRSSSKRRAGRAS
jgi:hypothetical protein